MRNALLFLSLLFGVNMIFAQAAPVSNAIGSILPDSIFARLFPSSTLDDLGVSFPVFRTYCFTDKGGTYYLLLTENQVGAAQEINDSIRAFCFKTANNTYSLEWTLGDFILPKGNEFSEEFGIWFWTKYTKLEDMDDDGLADVVLAYGTNGINNLGDGRIKIMVYYQGKKLFIRHQNGELDFERNTQVDAGFYELPDSIQMATIQIMEEMTTNQHAIFPFGWQTAMKQHKTYFDER